MLIFYSFSEFAEQVEYLRAAIVSLGIKGKHCAVIGETSIEWISVYLALVSGCGVCIPIDKDLNDETVTYQLNHSDAEIIFVSKKYFKKIEHILSHCEKIKTVIVLRGEIETQSTAEFINNCDIYTLKDFLQEGKRQFKEQGGVPVPADFNTDNPCLIIFTSGTTGANKGVVITVGIAGFFLMATAVMIVTAAICYKKGFTITRWLFKIFDYTRWFKKKKKA